MAFMSSLYINFILFECVTITMSTGDISGMSFDPEGAKLATIDEVGTLAISNLGESSALTFFKTSDRFLSKL